MNDIRDLVRKVINKQIPFHKIEEEVGNANIATIVRRKALEEMLGINLPAIGSTIIDFVEIYGRNIKNPIGAIQIPLGVAGPLRINGVYANGEYYIPLATIKGFLVANIDHGCKALTYSGGVYTEILYNIFSYITSFSFPTVHDPSKLINLIDNISNKLRSIIESWIQKGRLLKIEPFILGNNIILHFIYCINNNVDVDTIVTASNKACKYIVRNYLEKMGNTSLKENIDIRNTLSMTYQLFKYDKAVIAKAIVKREVLVKVLGTTPEKIVYSNIYRNILDSYKPVSISCNLNILENIMAILIAIGQDPVQIIRNYMGSTWTRLRNSDLYISTIISSPELTISGDGVELPTQKEALSIMGLANGNDESIYNDMKLAEIIASAALAGELSLLSALPFRK